MDSLESPNDNTTVLRMKQDFDAFISHTSVRPARTQSTSGIGRLDFSTTLDTSSDFQSSQPVSMKAILGMTVYEL